jgi:hypothetical protein
MNTETPTPTAAELLNEWKALVASIGMTQPSEYPFIMEIAAQLDEMCESIYIGDDGFPYFGDFKYEGNGGKTGTHDAQWIAPEYKVSDLIALLQWLLIKENHGK